MKGFLTITMVYIILTFLIIFGIALAIWYETENNVARTAPSSINAIISGAALAGPMLKRKKGIVLTTSMLATIVFFLVVITVIFLVLASLGAEAGPGSSSFFYGVFDSIISSLPWVS